MHLQHQDETQSYKRLLIVYFGLTYFMQSFSGLVGQPLQFFLKEGLGMDPAQVASYLSVLVLPWVIKPLYGLVSDYIPLAGYHRKSWLLVMNGIAALGFVWLTGGSLAPAQIILAQLLAAFGTASTDVIVDALMVENGNRLNATATFQSTQWLWYSLAAIVTSLGGGYLCTIFSPAGALRASALIASAAPLTVFAASWLIVKEEKVTIDMDGLKETTASLLNALNSRTLWAVAAFLAFWNFSPSFGTPMYYHMTDNLKFSQDFIGQLGALSFVGSVAGAWLFRHHFEKLPTKSRVVFSIGAGVAGTLAYLALLTPGAHSAAIAVIISLVFGTTGMVATLTALTLAARACPEKAEGFTFATLMSLWNGSAQLSALIGAWLFVHTFNSQMAPLIWLSAATTAACLLLMPLLNNVADATETD